MVQTTDPAGLRAKAAEFFVEYLRGWTNVWQDHRLGVVNFGSDAPQDKSIPVQPVAAASDKIKQAIWQIQQQVTSQHLGHTIFVTALREAKRLLDEANAFQPGRQPAVIILTDGEPDDGARPKKPLEYFFRETENYVGQNLPRERVPIYVVAIDQQNQYWPSNRPYWERLCQRAIRIESAERGALIPVYMQVMGDLLGLQWEEVKATDVEIPPYLERVSFTLFKVDPEVKLRIVDSEGKEITAQTLGVYHAGESWYESYSIPDPHPGLWKVEPVVPEGGPFLGRMKIYQHSMFFHTTVHSPRTLHPLGKPISFKVEFRRRDGKPVVENPAIPLRIYAKVMIPSATEPSEVNFTRSDSVYRGNQQIEAGQAGIYKVELHVRAVSFDGKQSRIHDEQKDVEVEPLPYLRVDELRAPWHRSAAITARLMQAGELINVERAFHPIESATAVARIRIRPHEPARKIEDAMKPREEGNVTVFQFPLPAVSSFREDMRQMISDLIRFRWRQVFRLTPRRTTDLVEMKIVGQLPDRSSYEGGSVETAYERVEDYKAQHKSIFWKYIEERLIEERRKRTVQEDGRTRQEEEIKPGLLKEDTGRGCLWHAQRFLEILGELYGLTAQNLTGWITARDYPRQIAGAQLAVNAWQTQMTEVTFFERMFGSGGDVRGFCDALSRLLELEQEQMLAQAAKEMFEALRDTCVDLIRDIEVWRSTFESGKRAIVSGLAELAAYRREKTKVVVRRYVTEPPEVNKETGQIKLDEIEQKLFEKYFGRHQTDYEEKVLKPFGWRIDPPGRYFPSDPAEWQARRHLRSALPAEFLPWDELSKDLLRWNYQFEQNLLQIGFFRGLKDEVDIFDVLQMKGEDAADLANRLVNQSTPMLSFSATAQRSEGVNPAEANWFTIWGAFGKATGDSAQLVKDLDAGLRGQRGQPQTLPDLRHEISAIQARHLFVVEAIPQFEDFKREYRKKQRESFRARRAEDAAAQPHVFLEERNAASLEIDFTEVPHTGPTDLRQSHEPLLEPAVVCCLADERFLLNIALALWQGWLAVRPNPATGQVEHVYVMAGGREIKVGGGNPFDALVDFHTDTNVDIADARRDLQERAAGLRSDKRQQGKQAFEDFIKEMEQKAAQPLLSKGVLDRHPEAKQLDQVLRLLLWRDAQKERAYF
ncbi:MAG: VWA domain-containing protein [Acidobacteria bacterium]|nr:VWA domain-containing protein [Acidobacteriota bacterium]